MKENTERHPFTFSTIGQIKLHAWKLNTQQCGSSFMLRRDHVLQFHFPLEKMSSWWKCFYCKPITSSRVPFVNGNITVCQLSPAFGTEEKIWNPECISSDFEWGGIIEKRRRKCWKKQLFSFGLSPSVPLLHLRRDAVAGEIVCSLLLLPAVRRT